MGEYGKLDRITYKKGKRLTNSTIQFFWYNLEYVECKGSFTLWDNKRVIIQKIFTLEEHEHAFRGTCSFLYKKYSGLDTNNERKVWIWTV